MDSCPRRPAARHLAAPTLHHSVLSHHLQPFLPPLLRIRSQTPLNHLVRSRRTIDHHILRLLISIALTILRFRHTLASSMTSSGIAFFVISSHDYLDSILDSIIAPQPESPKSHTQQNHLGLHVFMRCEYYPQHASPLAPFTFSSPLHSHHRPSAFPHRHSYSTKQSFAGPLRHHPLGPCS